MLRNRSGFTLVELMVVVIIVLVLAGIAVPVYMHYVQEGKKTSAYATVDSIVSGAYVWYQKHDTYVGATIETCLASDDVANAEAQGYFTFAMSGQGEGGFTVTATENGDWAPEGAYIQWVQENAGPGNAGTGQFYEVGWE
jgi:type IV pilus assembly protein PilE